MVNVEEARLHSVQDVVAAMGWTHVDPAEPEAEGLSPAEPSNKGIDRSPSGILVPMQGSAARAPDVRKSGTAGSA